MYAELIGNYKKYRIKSLYDNKMSQVPFSSLNYGLDTSSEGRLVTSKLLDAMDNGMGRGETPIFPINIFILKEGISYNPEDRNYDLFKKACKVSAKRLFPTFSNQDATFNLKYYDPDNYKTHISYMGCRTRVLTNVNGPNECASRGNFAFTTLNLPKYALEARGNIKKFFQLLNEYINISREYLEERYKVISKKKVKNFPFVMGGHMYMGSENLKDDDYIEEALKNASLSIGFCGLAECLVALTGKHHGECDKAQELGLKIIKHIRRKTDEFTEETHMNWSTFSTPAESCAYRLQQANIKEYGIIKGVTDKPYQTNSFHIPVYYNISIIDKINKEAPYHELCNAGHISYVELDGDCTKNLTAFETVVRAMHDANMGYFAINHPVDVCPNCRHTGVINDICPVCNATETGKHKLSLKRIKKGE